MRRLRNVIARYLPRRRRRFWWYVSPRRHGLGLGAMALLVLLGFGYWRLTNDHNVHDQARRYLHNLTGGRVEIGQARFDLFGGLELGDVRIYVPNSSSPAPLLRAGTLILRHHPWSLLTGKLRVTEVICLGAEVTLEHDVPSDAYNFERLLEARRRRGDAASLGNLDYLPPIRMRDARLQWVDVEGKLRLPHEPAVVSLTLQPQGRQSYLATFEQQRAGARETATFQTLLDVNTGRATRLSGSASLVSLDRALPGKYRQWRQRYDVAGEIRWRSVADPSGPQRLELELGDVSLRLPSEEGGLELAHVRGKMSLDEKGLTLEGVGGQVRGMGDARFELSGRYDGFDSSSPFELALRAWSLEIPQGPNLQGPLGDLLARMHNYFTPVGKMDLDVQLKREADAMPTMIGAVGLRNMGVTVKWFPYAMERVNGTIRLEKGRAVLEGLTASHGPAQIIISGYVANWSDYEVAVESRDVPVDQPLYDALPPKAQAAWRELEPQGTVGALVRVKPVEGHSPDVDVELRPDGRASVCYRGFPYRLEHLLGRVRVHGPLVEIDGIRGGSGSASCTIAGELTVTPEGVAADLAIEARRLGVDQALIDAVNTASGRNDWIILPAGTVEQAVATIYKQAGGKLDFTIRTSLEGVSGGMTFAPYLFEEGKGELTIEPGRLIFRDFRAGRGDTTIALNGQVLLSEQPGLDLNVQARRLLFGPELRQVLPTGIRATWDQFAPAGPADLDLTLRHNLGDGPPDDYRLEIRPQGMQARWRRLPLAPRDIRGKLVLTPGHVELADLHGCDGQAAMSLTGSIDLGPQGASGRLSAQATGVEIDAPLLSAAPPQVGAIARRFDPGGRVDVQLDSLEFHHAPSVAATQLSAAASQPAIASSRPADTWRAGGTIRLHDAVVVLDFGRRKLDGQIAGSAEFGRQGLGLDLALDLDRLDLDGREVRRLVGRCVKTPDSRSVTMQDFTAQVGTGRAAGWAQIDLGDPCEYGLHMSVQDVPLENLLKAASQPGQPVGGLLEGSLELTGTVGRIDSRRASGLLRITQAHMYQLPVVLGLFHVIPIALPGKTYLSEGQIDYHLEGQRLTFDEIHVSGPASSMVGSGTVDLRREMLNLVFLTGPAGKLPPLARLAMPLGPLSGEIMQIRVFGRLDKPQVQPVALRSLDEALHVLLNPSYSPD
jgi:hypothetical protein